MNNDLQGKTALITGGSSGIGKAVALLYGQYGANVMVSDLDETQGQTVVAEIAVLRATKTAPLPATANRPMPTDRGTREKAAPVKVAAEA